MEITVAGFTYIFGATYRLTLNYSVLDKSWVGEFLGIKRSHYDGAFHLYFLMEHGGEIGYPISSIADATLLENIK